MSGFRVEKPVLQPDIREQTEEEVIETLHLALKETKDRLTPVQMAQEILKVFDPKEAAKALSSVRKGNFS